MTHTFAVNKTNTHISLKGGYSLVPASGFLKVPKADLEHDDFKQAISEGWLEVSDDEPETKAVTGPVVISSLALDEGMTADDLKAMLDQGTPDKGTGVTVTKLGQQEETKESTPVIPTESEETGADTGTEASAKTGRKSKQA